MKRRPLLIVAVVILVILAASSLYTVREGEQVVITQFQKPVAFFTEAGLKLKVPFIQSVHRLEKRLLPWDGESENIQTRDMKRIHVDVWARWRIVDPVKFFEAINTEQGGYRILDGIVDAAVRNVVGSQALIEVVRSSNRELVYESEELARAGGAGREAVTIGRAGIEAEILRVAGARLAEGQNGMELTDVRLKRVNYNLSVRAAVYRSMQAERLRIARLFESEAQQEMNVILGEANRELEKILGEKEQRSAEIRGEADAAVIKIAAEAYSRSPRFYEFLRRLEAYRKTLGSDTHLILSTASEFFRLLHEPTEPQPRP